MTGFKNEGPVSEKKPDTPRAATRSSTAGGRETVESVIVAFTLALLFRAFEAEAFVIPTGSMAPTLMGRHKDLVCELCGTDFRVGASAEEDDQSQSLRLERRSLEAELESLEKKSGDSFRSQTEQAAVRSRIESLRAPHGPLARIQARLEGKMIIEATCPGCRFGTPLVRQTSDQTSYDPRYPSYSGDRILVSKFAYDFAEPQRWDVVVFKYPEDAKTNYIKRLIGLPGEIVSIAGGDIWTRKEDQAVETIARKPPKKILAMLQCVHESRYESQKLLAAGWPAGWSDWRAPNTDGPQWKANEQFSSFTINCSSSDRSTLRYRHFVPSDQQWAIVERGDRFDQDGSVIPALIDDFQSYNAIPTRPHWVGDLAVEVQVESLNDSGVVEFDLVEGGEEYRCGVNLTDGRVSLEFKDESETDQSDIKPPTAQSRMKGRGRWTVLFANVDNQLSVFVDGKLLEFDRSTMFVRSPETILPRDDIIPEPGNHTPLDTSPVGITSIGATVRVSDIRVLRDIYYIGAVDVGNRPGELLERSRLEYVLGPDQFFVLGDNSAASKDGRMWREGHHVDRNLLIGKALVIFWPHAVSPQWSVPVNLGIVQMRLPCWPNFARMRFIR